MATTLRAAKPDISARDVETKRAIETLVKAHNDAMDERDTEIREVLEGLAVNRYNGKLCWCDKGRAIPMGLAHESTCLATQRLWEKLQPVKENT